MDNVDVIGINSVASLIEQSGLSKFIISKQGATRQTTPVFEWIKGGGNKQAVESFKQWANNILQGGGNSLIYDILLIDSVEDEEEENAQSARKKRKLKFSFALKNQLLNDLPVINGYSKPDNTAEIIQIAVSNALAERDKNDLIKKINELSEEIKKLKEEDEEEDDEDNGSLNGINNMQILNLLANALSGKKTEAVINGTDEQTEVKKLNSEQINNINKALKVLHKYDSQIDTDLLKLAAIAQNNTGQFNFLLNALRNM